MGNVIMSGIVPQLTAPEIPVIAGSELAVGSVVKLMENGSAVEYMVVHHGKPSSLYDSSCDGLWLLRKAIFNNYRMDSSDNDYKNSDMHTYLNSTFYKRFDAETKAVVKTVKIPYHNGQGQAGTMASGANGLSANVFLLSGYEVGFTTSNNQYFPIDGAKLSYFLAGNGDAANTLRIAYYGSTATEWDLRSPHKQGSSSYFTVDTDGDYGQERASNSVGTRPALILPNNAVFDKTTLILKGVA